MKRLGIGGWGPGAYCLEINDEGKAVLPVFELDPIFCIGTSIVADGNWHHLAGTWDGSTMKIYVDGKLENSVPTVGKISANEEVLCIGAAEGQAIPLKGIIDEVKIYNKALSEGEMDELMRSVISAIAPADKLSTTWGAIKLKASQ